MEGYESFKVALQAQDTNTLIGTGTAIVTINPDDAAINITATDSIVKEGTGSTSHDHTFTLTRSAYLDSAVTVNWGLVGSGANPVNAADFGGTLPSGSITFGVGETSKTLTITPNTDAIYEPHESYEVVLTTSQYGVVLETDHASGMVLNDDSGLTVVGTNLDKSEGNPGAASQLTFTVQRTGDTTGVSTVHWELIPAATDGASAADFVAGTLPAGDLTFTRGETSKLITLPLTTDNVIEPDKGFSIRLSGASAGSELLVSEVSGFIRNDDAAFTLQSAVPVAEGHSGSTSISFTVQRTGDLTGTDTVDYTVVGSGTTPADASDFTGGFPAGTVTFTAGQSSRTITLNVAGDSALEADETFTVTLGNASSGTTIATAATVATIANDDDRLAITATNVDLAEAANGTTRDFTFTVTRDGFVDRASSVNWSVAGTGGNAADAADFLGGSLPTGTLNFAANETSKTITITVNGDYYQEADEGFRVTLSSPSAGTSISTTTADGVIRNDDTGLAIAASTTNLAEGDSGVVTHEFTVTRSGVTTGSSTVNWTLTGTGGNPVDAADFGGTLPSGTVTFVAGETSRVIQVQASGDTSIESSEGFTITLSGADGNADIMTATAVGTVVADDIGIAISAGTASVVEGASGSSRVLQYTVTRSGDIASPVTIDWAASGMDAADFANGTQLSGTLTFSANETSKTISLTQTGDNVNEADETLTITLSNPAGNPAHDRTYIATAIATTDVANDDAALTIAADNVALVERNTGDGASTAFTFTITRAGDTAGATDIDWTVQLPGGAGSAAGNDFVAGQDLLTSNGGLPSGTVHFAAGENSQQVTVLVATDNQVEQNETFNVVLQGAGINTELTGATASATITNDDTGFSIVAVDASHTEGHSGTTNYTFSVTRAGAIGSAATVDWAVTGSGGAAADAADFVGGSLPAGTVSFAAGEASQTLTIQVAGDSTVESDEGFTVTISNAHLTDATPQTIVDASATGSIVNDDQSFAVSAANASISEGSSGTKQVAFTITRSGDISASSTVDYAVSGSNGANTADLQGGVLPSGTLTFGAGVDQLAVTLTIISDTVVEAANETFTLTLSNPSAGFISTATDSTVVTNDDTNFALTAPAPFTEGGSGSTTATFAVTRSGDTTGTGSVAWAVHSATGLNSADFTGNQDALGTNSGLPSGTVSFGAGETSKNITIQVAGDLTLESDEALQVVLSAPVNGTIEGTDGDKSTTILTDDDSFSISTLTTTRAEGNSDSSITYTVTRTGSMDGARDLTWTISGVNASDLADGQASTGTVSFVDGQSTQTIVVNVKGDSVVETDETMTVTLSAPPANSVIGTAAASTVLTNDDAGVAITPLLADKNEGNSSYVDYTYTITRSGNTSQISTVHWAVDTSVVNSVNGTDFYASQSAGVYKDGSGIPYGDVTFASGQTSQTITLRVAGDSTFELDETLRVGLSSPSAGTEITTATANGYVRNDDAQFNITAGTASLTEGDAGHGTGVAYTYTVTRTGNLSQTSTVDWNVVHGTTNSSDFSNGVGDNINPSGTLTFTSGVATQTITVYAYGDTGVGSIEGNENFSVAISNPNAGSSLGTTTTSASTIAEDDTKIAISVNDMRVAEDVSGQNSTYTITLTRSGDLNKVSAINWAVQTTSVYDAEENSWATAADTTDFGGSFPTGSVTFNNGESSKTVTITVPGDNTAEADEWFQVYFSGATNTDQVTTIHNDPRITSGSAFYNTTMGGWVADNAQYTNTNYGYLFAEIERDEAEFRINDYEITAEGNPTSYHTLNTRAEGDSVADGGAGGTVEHIFAVERTIATAGAAWVTWRVVGDNGIYTPATAADFAGGSDARGLGGSVLASGTLNFVDGQQWGYIKVYTTVDDLGEYDEGFRVYLDGVSGGSSIYTYDNGGYNQNTGYIKNDDTRFDAAVNDVTEGGTLTYTVTRTGDLRGTDTVDWSLTLPGSETTNESNASTATWYKLDPSDISNVTPDNGSATYNAGVYSGTLTFADGETTKTITVVTNDDSWTETWREELPIILSNATNVDAGEPNNDLETATTGYTDTARVYDNEPDPLISVSASTSSVYEGTGSGNTVTYTITRTDQAGRDGALNYPTTVAWQITGTNINSGGAGAEIANYTGNAASVNTSNYSNQTTGLVSFAAGETTKTVVVTFNGDTYVENDYNLTFAVKDASTATGWPWYTDQYGPANIDTANASVTTSVKNDDIRLWVGGWDTSSPYNDTLTATAYEGNPLTFNVVRGGRLDSDVTVSYTITHGTTAAGDFTSTTGSFTLAAQGSSYGTYTYNVSLASLIADDATVENDETFTMVLNTPADTAGSAVRFQSYYTDYSNSYTSPTTSVNVAGTIRDDDTTYTLTPASTSLVETDQGANQTFSFTVGRGGTGYTGPATLKWKVEAIGGAPVDAGDFSSTDTLGINGGLPSGTVSFANGVLTGNFNVLVKGDLTAEANETFRVVLFEDTLSGPSPSITNTQAINSATLTVLTDDTGIAIADASIAESDTNQTLNFTVTRSGDLSGASSMNWSLLHGTTNASDFSGATSGSLSFAASESSKTIAITVAGDVTPEAIEQFTIQLSSLTGIDDAIDVVATGTISNDDSSFAVSAGADTVESSSQTFTITRTHDTAQNQTITWSVAAGSANAADFGGTLPSGSVTFAAGEMSKTVTITPTSDATPESDETYTVNIALGAGTTGDTISTGTVTSTILNDDAAIYLAANQTTLQEGHSATTPFSFTVTRSGNTSGTASVDWKLSSAAAVAADFTDNDLLGSNGGLPSGTVTFADGESAKTITINVVGDEVIESDESITLTLSNAVGGSIITGTAGSTIQNDDSSIVIAAASAVKDEGNSGTTPYTFTITRTGYLDEAETVDFTVAGSGANPANSADFSATSGTVTLAAGQATTTLTINVNGDLTGEPDEGFTVTLSNPSSGMTITTATATGTIQADDIVFDVTAPVTQLEGNPGTTTNFDFVVTRAGNLSGTQTLNWSVAGIGADGTSAGDFDSTSGTITFDANDTSKTISVPVKGDYLGEADEQFRLTLTGPGGVVFTHSAADATITDDEASLRISATDANKSEGADGTTSYTFTVTRTGNTALAATVDWSVDAGDSAANDFNGNLLPSGNLSFASGETSKTITIVVVGDTTVEANENFTVNLANASTGADIVVGTATGTIISDDVQWSVAAQSIPSTEGDGPNNFVFRVARTGSLSATTINWSTAGNGADAASATDFVGTLFPTGTLVFAQGQTFQDFTVQVVGDSIREADEGFSVTLAAPVDSLTHSFFAQSANATIVNDDDVMSLAALAANTTEGTGSNTAFTFTVTRDGSLAGASTVGWHIIHGSTDAGDFAATSGTVNFIDGQSSATLSITALGDRAVESDESFSVELYNPGTGSTIDGAASTVAGVIHNDDVDLALSAAGSTAVEGDNGTAGQATFTVTRTGDLSVSTSVDWSVVAGTATAADFAGGALPGGSLTFAAGETSKTITVNLAGDGLDEGNESFTVQLSNASAHADITTNNIVGNITNDDDTLTVSAVSAVHLENNSGTTAFTFRIDRSCSSTGTTSVDWSVAGSGVHSASADDFVATTGTVTFADGETSKTFTVEAQADALGEYDETFAVSLLNPAFGSTAALATAGGTIQNDDAVLFVSADSVSVAEGGSGAETTFTFTVTRSGDTSGSASALWEVVSSGSHPANAADFGGVFPSGAVAFQAGEATQQISLTILGDVVGEYDETFSVLLSDPANATILEGSAQTIIANDDTGISITALDAHKAEGNSGATPFTFQIERLGSTVGTASVDWSVQGTGSYPAGADDFAGGALPSGTVTFADGESVKTITVNVAGDEIYGQDQTFHVALANSVGANLVTAEAAGIILNDDSQISVAAQNASLVEGDSGSTLYSFVLTRDGALDTTATIDWEVVGSGGHQADASDFLGHVLPTGSVTFGAGETSHTVTVAVAGDTLTEVDETFTLQLHNPGTGVSIAPNAVAAEATIVSDDDGVVLVGLDVDLQEGVAGTHTAFTYQVLRSGDLGDAVTLHYEVTGGVDGADFVSPLTGSFQMAAGENSHLLTLTVQGDAVAEANEQFNVSLSGTGINIDSTPVNGVIRSDEITDLTGNGANTLHLATAELLQQDVDIFTIVANGAESYHQLMIEGDAADEVIIADISNYTHTQETVNAATYDLYTNSIDHTQLLINHAVTNVHGI